MIMEIEFEGLVQLVSKQLGNIFIFDQEKEMPILESATRTALRRCEKCFEATQSKYYNKEGKTYFSPFHSGQNTIFLYFLSNSVFSDFPAFKGLADRIYYLNRTLNCADLFYEISLPQIFFLDHPLSSVMGRAIYGNYFSFSQNCTVGNNKGFYPEIGENMRMMSGSKILGKCKISDNVIISADTYVKDTDIPPCSIVFGKSPDLSVVEKNISFFRR